MRGTVESANDAALSAAIGRLVRKRRIDLGLTVKEAARRGGLSQAQVSNLERGYGNPTASTIESAMKAVGMTLQDLAGGEHPTMRIVGGVRPAHAVDYGALLEDRSPRDTPSDGPATVMLIDCERLDE